MSVTPNQNQSNPDDQAQQPNVNEALLARLDAQDKLIADLLAKQTPVKATPEDKGGVLVKQKRLVMNDGNILEEHDVQEQYYAADVYERMMRETDGKTAFGHMGYAAPEIIKDTRKKKK